MVPAMRPGNPLASRPIAWLGKGALRLLVLLAVGAAIAGIAAAFGIARDYGYLHASILTGSPGGQYHALGTRLADRARREHGMLAVTSTAGSIENVSRLSKAQSGCAEKFALIQDGTPVPPDSGLELLGRLPKPEVSPAARTPGPRLSHLCGPAWRIDRNRPARLRHGLPGAATVRRSGLQGARRPPVVP